VCIASRALKERGVIQEKKASLLLQRTRKQKRVGRHPGRDQFKVTCAPGKKKEELKKKKVVLPGEEERARKGVGARRLHAAPGEKELILVKGA